jgi:hypothetical protein
MIGSSWVCTRIRTLFGPCTAWPLVAGMSTSGLSQNGDEPGAPWSPALSSTKTVTSFPKAMLSSPRSLTDG